MSLALGGDITIKETPVFFLLSLYCYYYRYYCYYYRYYCYYYRYYCYYYHNYCYNNYYQYLMANFLQIPSSRNIDFHFTKSSMREQNILFRRQNSIIYCPFTRSGFLKPRLN